LDLILKDCFGGFCFTEMNDLLALNFFEQKKTCLIFIEKSENIFDLAWLVVKLGFTALS